jgi:hypothetical protein
VMILKVFGGSHRGLIEVLLQRFPGRTGKQ